MARDTHRNLSRRERQIMDVLFRLGRATGAEIHAALPDPPSYSAVRAALRVLQDKGHIRHQIEGLRYVWTPRQAREQARRGALRHMVQTFFDGSVEQAVAALLDEGAAKLTEPELLRLRALIDQAGGSHQ